MISDRNARTSVRRLLAVVMCTAGLLGAGLAAAPAAASAHAFLPPSPCINA
jgi:hypothetical protein